MANTRRTFTPTKLNLSTEITDVGTRNELEAYFNNYRIQRELSVEAQRKALISQLESKTQEAAAQITLTKFLSLAGEHLDQVKTEPIWFAYTNTIGEIILESPFTERDMRNSVRLQRAQMEQAAQSMDDTKNDDLYETDSE